MFPSMHHAFLGYFLSCPVDLRFLSSPGSAFIPFSFVSCFNLRWGLAELSRLASKSYSAFVSRIISVTGLWALPNLTYLYRYHIVLCQQGHRKWIWEQRNPLWDFLSALEHPCPAWKHSLKNQGLLPSQSRKANLTTLDKTMEKARRDTLSSETVLAGTLLQPRSFKKENFSSIMIFSLVG